MKRELKFRVYDKEIRRMSKSFTLGAFLIQWSDGDMDMPMQFADGDKRFEFMQFTGLFDKNGKEIYEGDVLNIHVFTEELGEGYGVVEGEKEYVGEVFIAEFGTALRLGKEEEDWFYLLNMNGMIHEESFEVIGNIFENPLLI